MRKLVKNTMEALHKEHKVAIVETGEAQEKKLRKSPEKISRERVSERGQRRKLENP